jgi:4-amino-4-deoxy-L-arabinose transferase-like glycosyltransferase
LAAIPACGWLAHELFQSRKTTWLTLALSTFFPQRVALGLAPLSSIMFAFLILMTMASFVRWLRTDSRVALLMGALFGVLTSTVRYEGWLFNAA